jgi:hypothetical protein
MTLSRKHKLLFAVLGVAVAALLVDWLFLRDETTGPSQAQASVNAPAVVPEAAPPDPVPEPPAAAAATPDTEQPPLADRLRKVAETLGLDPTDMRDAFVPPEDWLSELKPPEAVAPQRDLAGEFAQEHRLTSVILIGTGGSAVVDGRAIRVGQELDGFRLTRLTPGGAVFQSGDSQVELRLRPVGDTP